MLNSRNRLQRHFKSVKHLVKYQYMFKATGLKTGARAAGPWTETKGTGAEESLWGLGPLQGNGGLINHTLMLIICPGMEGLEMNIYIYYIILLYYIYVIICLYIYVYYRGKRKARHKSTCHEGGQESKKNDDSTSANSKWKAEQGPKNWP